ncbi:MAG: hypothetical protein A2506_05565 [Elusimicrobia bacterium RIFOXYD12_FULL_66_9]|nr:MAG: hypothetical protein A2506_05565 [Elusimicrobia bacterium RIFOXYD12_FULL_66_9]
MTANVLNSTRAISMSVQVVREFIRLRGIARSHDPLKMKLGQLARSVNARLDKHESQIDGLLDAVESLFEPAGDSDSKRLIGFAP